MERESERLLASSLASLSKGRQRLFSHIGLWVAALSLIVAALVTFTEVSLLSLSLQSLTLTVAVYAAVTVVMYLSLEEEGELAGRTESAYKEAESTLTTAAARITAAHYAPLEAFCRRYTEEELAERRARLLLTYGISDEERQALPSAARRRLRRLRPLQINASMLLGKAAKASDSPLCNPDRRRRTRLLTRLMPSLLCMTFGIGIAIGARDALTASAILEGIFKLSALLIVGLRGYVQGYLFVSEAEIPFIRAKARLLERFLCEDAEEKSH